MGRPARSHRALAAAAAATAILAAATTTGAAPLAAAVATPPTAALLSAAVRQTVSAGQGLVFGRDAGNDRQGGGTTGSICGLGGDAGAMTINLSGGTA